MTEHETPELTSAEVQQELAEERTEMALQRTVLANERTLNSWLRTGLAILAAGFTIGILLGEEGSIGPARAFGITLIVVGGLVCIIGFVRYRKLCAQLEPENVSSVPLWLLELLVGFFLVISFVGVVMLLRWV